MFMKVLLRKHKVDFNLQLEKAQSSLILTKEEASMATIPEGSEQIFDLGRMVKESMDKGMSVYFRKQPVPDDADLLELATLKQKLKEKEEKIERLINLGWKYKTENVQLQQQIKDLKNVLLIDAEVKSTKKTSKRRKL